MFKLIFAVVLSMSLEKPLAAGADYLQWKVIEPVTRAELATVIEFNLNDACLDLWAVNPRSGADAPDQAPPTEFAVVARKRPGCTIGD